MSLTNCPDIWVPNVNFLGRNGNLGLEINVREGTP